MNVYSVAENTVDDTIYDIGVSNQVLSGRSVFPEYEVSVDLRLTQTNSGLTNVLALQADNGNVILTVNQQKDSTALQVCSGINCFNTVEMGLNDWFNVKITQTRRHFSSAHDNAGTHIIFEIIIDDEPVYEIQNDAAQRYTNAKASIAYGSNIAEGQYRNFKFITTASNDGDMTAQLDKLSSALSRSLYYSNLKQHAVLKFNRLLAFQTEQFKQKYADLDEKCTYPATWEQNQLEDTVDRYDPRGSNACDAVKTMIDGHEKWGEVFTRNCVREKAEEQWAWLNRRMEKMNKLGNRLKMRLGCRD